MSSENLRALLGGTVQNEIDTVEKRLDHAINLLRETDKESLSEDIQTAQESLERYPRELEEAQALVATLPTIIEAFEIAGFDDIPDKVIIQLADKLRLQAPDTPLIEEYPHLSELFSNDRNWVDTKTGPRLKRGAAKKFFVLKDSSEIESKDATQSAFGLFFKSWEKYHRIEIKERFGTTQLLTTEQMTSFLEFIAYPPQDAEKVPSKYTIQPFEDYQISLSESSEEISL